MSNTPSDGPSAEGGLRDLLAQHRYQSKAGHGERGLMAHHIDALVSSILPWHLAALARARADALEEAARVCEGSVSIDEADESWNDACDGCAHKIRTLPAPPQAQPTQDAGGGASEGCPDGYGKRWAARCVNGPETARIIEGVWGDGYLAGLRAAKGAPR